MTLRVASLNDIIASKKAAGRERDLAVLPVLERTLEAAQTPPRRRGSCHARTVTVMPRKKTAAPTSARRKALAALRTESDRQFDDLIRRRLALPVEKRMNFLRRRLPGGGSCL